MCDATAQQLAFRRYNRVDGLPSDYVLCMAEDKRGFLWFGTDRGAARYDGSRWRVFTTDEGLTSNFVSTIAVDSGGAVWFGTFDGGVCRFDANGVRPVAAPGRAKDAHVKTICFDRCGRTYILARDVLRIQRRGQWLAVPDLGAPLAIGALHTGDILLMTSRGFFTIPATDEDAILAVPLAGNSYANRFCGGQRVPDIAQATDGTVWLSDQTGLFKARIGPNSIFVLEPVSTLNGFSSLVDDADGRIWAATERSGILQICGSAARMLTAADGLPTEELRSMFRDSEGNIWITTLGNGAMRYLGDHIRYYSAAKPVDPENVTSVHSDSRGQILLATPEQLAVFSTGSVKAASPRILTIRDSRCVSELSNGDFLVGTFRGIQVLDGSTFRMKRMYGIPFGISGMASVESGADSGLWAGTYGNGIVRINRATQTQFHAADGLASDMVETVERGHNGVWFLTRTAGATVRHEGAFTTYSKRDGLPSDAVNCVLDEDSVVWFGTNRGLAVLRAGRITALSPSSGEEVIALMRPRTPGRMSDSLWVLTSAGLYLIDHGAAVSFGGTIISPFADARINRAGAAADSGFFWLATTRGAVRIDVRKAIRPDSPPRIALVRVSADGTGFATDATGPEELNGIPSTMTFEFAGLTFRNEQGVRFAIVLDGLDTALSPPTAEHEIRYRNLLEGEYKFRVYAINADGIRSSRPAEFAFIIPPPLARTAWFRGLILVIGIVAIGGAVRYYSSRKFRRQIEDLERERARQEERQRTRERIARDLHDDLASTVGSAGMFLESARRKLGGAGEDSAELLKKSSSLINEAEQSMSDIVWSVSPSHDTLGSMFARIRLHTTDICRVNGIPFGVSFPDECASRPISGDIRRSVFLIFKEAIHNAVRHGYPRRVDVLANLESDLLTLSITDDGSGFSISNPPDNSERGGHGLGNMRQRAGEIGGVVEIRSGPDAGTTVTLSVRLPQMTQAGH